MTPHAPASGQVGNRVAAAHPSVLVIDDEADLRELLELTLLRMGLQVDLAGSVAEARVCIGRQRYALCLTDMRLPDGDGLEIVELLAREHPDTPVAVITAFGSTDNAVAALKAGAFDYLAKPVALDTLRTLVRGALQTQDGPVSPDGRAMAGPGQGATGKAIDRLLGSSVAIEAVRAQILRLARSMAPVAITGESGCGKELAARLIHECGVRGSKPFVAVNCGAIPEALMEAEFFGYRKGAFTGATEDRDGFFQAADGGTLFLDEVADLPLAMQVKLLRCIQEKRVRKVGATQEEPVDVRIVSATHQDLAQCVAAGRFRQDLFYRLNVIALRMPPVRERAQDIPVLAQAILARLAARAGLAAAPVLSSVTQRYLGSYTFPGNVRELENILERALAFSDGATINVEDLGLRPAALEALASEPAAGPQVAMSGPEAATHDDPESEDAERETRIPAPGATPLAMTAEGVPASLPDYLDEIERQAILRALEQTRYNRTAAARLLGISFRALRYRMQRLQIQ